MPIVASSNGIRPRYRALAVIQLNKPVTPQEINDCVGTGDYAAKYISFLRRDGFVFDVTKVGRCIVAYTLIAEPASAAYFRNLQPKQKTTKQVGKVVPSTRISGGVTLKPAKAPAKKRVDPVVKTFGSSGEIASSYAIDSGWDSMDNVDVRDFLR